MDQYAKPDLTRTEERFRKKVQKLIEYCLYCQPYDGGEAVWIHGERTELDDLFYQCEVPEKYWNNIMDHLFCPYCGLNGFSIGIDVGLKTNYEIEVDEHMKEVYDLYGREVRLLEEHLEQYPLLAFKNKLAKRIYREIEMQKLPICSINGHYFRARRVESSQVINQDKMFSPPLGKPFDGRFNHAGQSHLYLANSKETAIKEIMISGEESLVVWCQEYLVNKKIDKILDLSFDWALLTPATSTLLLSLKIYNSIGRTDRNKEYWRPDYYLTRFIMDCAKSQGYNGIKYNSTKDTYEYNVVLFYTDRVDIVSIGKPSIEVFLNQKDRRNYDDIIDL